MTAPWEVLQEKHSWQLENVPVSHGCPFASYGPAVYRWSIITILHAYMCTLRCGPKWRTCRGTDRQG